MNWGNLIDWVGTAVGAKDYGISEWLNGGKKTANTGNRTFNRQFSPFVTDYTKAVRSEDKGTGYNYVPDGSDSPTTGGDTTLTDISTGGAYGGGGGSGIYQSYKPAYDPDAAERGRLKGLLDGYNTDNILNQIIENITNTARSRKDSRKGQYDDEVSRLTSTLQGAIPEIDRAFSAMGIGNSTYASDRVDDTNDEFNKSVKSAKKAYDDDLSTIGNWTKSQESSARENANRINRTKEASRNTNDLYSLRNNDQQIQDALGSLGVSRESLVEGGEAVKGLEAKIGGTSAFDSAKAALDGIIDSSLSTGTKESAREALSQGLTEDEKKKLSEIQINKPYNVA